MEKEDIVNRYEREKDELQCEIVALQRDRDDSLLMAENDKQQVSRYLLPVFTLYLAALCLIL
jgi:hypothetical protein